MKSIKAQKGQSLIEVIIALSIAVVIISAVTASILASLNSASRTKNQNLATQYAQQGLEIMRHMRSQNYQTFSTLSGDYCLDQTCTALNSNYAKCWQTTQAALCGQNVAGSFMRDVYITQTAANSDCSNTDTEVKVTVAWSDNTCKDSNTPNCQHVILSSCLSTGSSGSNLVP